MEKVKRFVVLSMVVAVLVFWGGCDAGKEDEYAVKREGAVQLVKEDLNAGNFDHALMLADSLEELGVLSSAMADGTRGTVYYYQAEYRKAEFYIKQALAGDALLKESPVHYVNMASLLSSMLMPKQDYEAAISTATQAYAVAREHSGEIAPNRLASLLNTIGQCQVGLGRLDEGEKSLTQSYMMQVKLAETDTANVATESLILYALNAAIAYMNGKHYEQAETWMESMEQLLDSADALQKVQESRRDRFRGRMNFMRADAYAHHGHLQEAEEAYRKGLATKYGQTPDGHIDASGYLEAVGRWKEAALAYASLDSLMQARGMPMSLDNIQGLLVPQYRTFLEAGRRDDAIQIGLRICESLDSAIVWQKRDASSELSIMYETQEKEAKIAEQETKLSSQRLITTIVVAVIVVVFLALFSIHRFRAARRLSQEHKRLLKAHDLLGEAHQSLEAANQQLEQKNADLVVANARAEESSRMKMKFIEQMSHEIRTPLNILSGFTQVATAPGIVLSDEEKAEINQGIIENTERITGLVNKMLELSEASSQMVIERDDEMGVVQIAEAAIADSGIREASHLQFDLQVFDGAEAMKVFTSQRHAVRALALLLDNARKFTRPAEAIVDTQQTASQHVRLYVRLTDEGVAYVVEDTGIGIPLEEADHIFERFVQLDDYYDGTGLGLTVARSWARNLGGDIVLDTTYTGGARFVFTLPIDCAHLTY